MKYFEEYKEDAHNWITLSTGEYYPDVLAEESLYLRRTLSLFRAV